MRYLQLMYTYAPAWGFGGPSRLMYDYARWLASHGQVVDVVAGDIHHDYSGNSARYEVLDGIRVRRVRVFFRHLVKRALNCVSPVMLLLAARRICASSGVTVLHIAEFRSPVFIYAAILRRVFPRRVVLVHSAFGMLHDKQSRLRSIYDPVFMGFMLRSVDVGLAQNEHEAQAYKAYCRRYDVATARVELLPLHTNGPQLGTTIFGGSAHRITLRQRYGVPLEAFVCVFLGRLHAEKGVVRAIDAFLRFEAIVSQPSLFLVIGRDDGFQNDILAHIDAHNACDKVLVINDIYQERFDYYALSDIFLGFPTIYEETMLSSVEALSCGTPVLVSREADLPFVEEGGAGFVIDFDVDEAVDRMLRVAADQAAFSARARAVAEEHFTADAACGFFSDIIATAARRRAAGVNSHG